MLRKASIKDVLRIQQIINRFAHQDLMLARSLNEIYENLRDFWVYDLNRKIIGCVALHISWKDTAEIKSLAVEKKFQRKGIGTQLVRACIKEAKDLGCKYIFVLTYIPKFFKRFGFKEISHKRLPQKIWVECIRCPKFPNCKEIAMLKKL
ncbi:MAG: N-acetyltransferase [Candidatus Omnitrophica bacterium]|nr:N-acetyltransferase [Candidatus Omnitrophota bacterium]